MKYKGTRLKIRTAGSIDEKVFLIPDITQEERIAMLEDIIALSKNNGDLKELFSIKMAYTRQRWKCIARVVEKRL